MTLARYATCPSLLIVVLGACAPSDEERLSGTGDEFGTDEGGSEEETGDQSGDEGTEEAADDVPPLVAFLTPNDASVVGGVVNVEVDASDDIGIAEVEFLVGGDQIGSLTEAPYVFEWDARTYVVGDVELEAIARDAAGNEASATVLVSNLSSGGSGGAYPGDVEATSEVDGYPRDYFLYVPTSYDPSVPTPLLTVHHGAGGPNYKGAFYRDYWQQTAESMGFIVLSQDSLDDTNGGWLVADVDFWIDEVTTTMEAYNIDRSKIYVWGYSAGGHFAHYLGMNFATFVTAYAVHSGTLGPFGQLAMPGTLERKIPVGIWVGNTDPNNASCKNTRDVFQDAGWVLGDDLSFTEFPGGHEAPPSQLPDVWAFVNQWALD